MLRNVSANSPLGRGKGVGGDFPVFAPQPTPSPLPRGEFAVKNMLRKVS